MNEDEILSLSLSLSLTLPLAYPELCESSSP